MNATSTHAKILLFMLSCCFASTAACTSRKVSRTQAQQMWHALVIQSDPANPSAIMGAPESHSCPQGGQQSKRMGLLSVRGDNLQLRAALHYAGCTVSSTQFDGELFVGIRSGSAARSSTSSYHSTLTGELVVPGRIPTRCVVDLASTRNMSGGHERPTYTGTFCGYDAASLGI